MDKKKYLSELEYLLQDVSDQERDEALDFYRNYFEEAGEENEQDVIQQLGSPEKVAATIKAGLNKTFDDGIKYGESGVYNSDYQKNNEIIDAKVVYEKEENPNCGRNGGFVGDNRNNRILKIIILFLALFLVLPVGGTLGGLLIGFIGMCFGLLCMGFFGTLGLAIAAVWLIINAGFLLFSLDFAGAAVLLGFACLMVAISWLTSAIGIGIVKFVPKVIKSIIEVCRNFISKVGA